jgi:hypothetical protein
LTGSLKFTTGSLKLKYQFKGLCGLFEFKEIVYLRLVVVRLGTVGDALHADVHAGKKISIRLNLFLLI